MRVIKFAVKQHGAPKDIFISLVGIGEVNQLIADLNERIPDVNFTDLGESS